MTSRAASAFSSRMVTVWPELLIVAWPADTLPPIGLPSTGEASNPRNSTSGWNGSASVSLKLTLPTCWSSAPSTLAAPLRFRSLDLNVWMLPGIRSLSTLKPGTGVTPTTTISSRSCAACGACCARTTGAIAVNVAAGIHRKSRCAPLRIRCKTHKLPLALQVGLGAHVKATAIVSVSHWVGNRSFSRLYPPTGARVRL